MRELKIIAFTHKTTDINSIGLLHLEDSQRELRLKKLYANSDVNELMYLSTCNRVEFVFVTEENLDSTFLQKFFASFNPSCDVQWMINNSVQLEGESAVKHIFNLASSLDSLVIGEREIITQVRNAYEECVKFNLTGDTIRLVIKHAIEAAKEVYTKTDIAKNPVSIVSLAYRTLREFSLKNNARFIIIGAGETNTNMAKFLSKHGFENFSVYNRTFSKAEKLAEHLRGKAFPLSELQNRAEGFDVLITCTGSEEPIVTSEVYQTLLAGEGNKKIVIDLALPSDVEQKVTQQFPMHYIGIEALKIKAEENLRKREKELYLCNDILENNWIEFQGVFAERQVIKAMQEVPQKVKEIRQYAVDIVFAKELEGMDVQSREVLDKVLAYMEKKYISVPMKMAKEIMLNKTN